MPPQPSIVVLTGASGAGKTTLIRALEQLALPGIACVECTAIYDALPGNVKADGAIAQDAILQHWIEWTLVQPALRVAVLATQIRPHKAIALLRRSGIASCKIVLIEAANDVRNSRLRGPRGEPGLASAQMDSWAAYLRGQADALDLPIIDTSQTTVESSLAELRAIVEFLTPP